MIKVSVENAVKVYGDVRAVDGVSLDARGGQVFALLGPNGAGKTTLIRMLMDITRPDSGTITFDGEMITPDLKHRIGYLPEERGLYKKQKLGAVLAYFGRLHGLDKETSLERAREWLGRVDLGEWEKKKVEELSKGMQQKAQIVLTLLHDPDLVILDEPFSGLDPLNIQVIKEFQGVHLRDAPEGEDRDPLHPPDGPGGGAGRSGVHDQPRQACALRPTG